MQHHLSACSTVKGLSAMNDKVNVSYSCEQSGHIMGQPYPWDKRSIRTTCVVPGCNYTIRKDV